MDPVLSGVGDLFNNHMKGVEKLIDDHRDELPKSFLDSLDNSIEDFKQDFLKFCVSNTKGSAPSVSRKKKLDEMSMAALWGPADVENDEKSSMDARYRHMVTQSNAHVRTLTQLDCLEKEMAEQFSMLAKQELWEQAEQVSHLDNSRARQSISLPSPEKSIDIGPSRSRGSISMEESEIVDMKKALLDFQSQSTAVFGTSDAAPAFESPAREVIEIVRAPDMETLPEFISYKRQTQEKINELERTWMEYKKEKEELSQLCNEALDEITSLEKELDRAKASLKESMIQKRKLAKSTESEIANLRRIIALLAKNQSRSRPSVVGGAGQSLLSSS